MGEWGGNMLQPTGIYHWGINGRLVDTRCARVGRSSGASISLVVGRIFRWNRCKNALPISGVTIGLLQLIE